MCKESAISRSPKLPFASVSLRSTRLPAAFLVYQKTRQSESTGFAFRAWTKGPERRGGVICGGLISKLRLFSGRLACNGPLRRTGGLRAEWSSVLESGTRIANRQARGPESRKRESVSMKAFGSTGLERYSVQPALKALIRSWVMVEAVRAMMGRRMPEFLR